MGHGKYQDSLNYLRNVGCNSNYQFLRGTLTFEVQNLSSEGEVSGFEVKMSSSEAQSCCSEGKTWSSEGEVSSFLLGCCCSEVGSSCFEVQLLSSKVE